jgi:hypothetical protein
MNWLSKLQPAEKNPVEVAHTSLRKLSEQGIGIPAQVASPIIEVHKAGDLRKVDPELEQRFLTAYGILNSKIKPVEDAKSHYRRSFYTILTILFLLQLYYSASLAVQARLIEVGSGLQAATSEAAVAGAPAAANARLKGLQQEQNTYLYLTRYLMQIPITVAGYVLANNSTAVIDKPEVVAAIQLDLATSFIGKFLLPVLYGMLGAVAFVLRRLSDETQAPALLRDPRNRYSLRVPIGALSGLAAGWLLQPAAGTVASSLSPFAIAFVAGYSAELVFTAMDRIVSAFTSPQVMSETADIRGVTREPKTGDRILRSDAEARPAEGDRSAYSTTEIDEMSSRAQANRDA